MIRIFLLLCLTMILACQTAQKAPPRKTSASPPPAKTKPAPLPAEAGSGAAGIVWLDSERLMPVLEQAQREKKVVFVELYASWCAPCKVMEEDVFTQTDTYRYLNKNFLNFRTDFDAPAGSSIAAVYEVKTLPTVLFLNPQGVVLERHTGIANPSLLRTMGDSALGKLR